MGTHPTIRDSECNLTFICMYQSVFNFLWFFCLSLKCISLTNPYSCWIFSVQFPKASQEERVYAFLWLWRRASEQKHALPHHHSLPLTDTPSRYRQIHTHTYWYIHTDTYITYTDIYQYIHFHTYTYTCQSLSGGGFEGRQWTLLGSRGNSSRQDRLQRGMGSDRPGQAQIGHVGHPCRVRGALQGRWTCAYRQIRTDKSS